MPKQPPRMRPLPCLVLPFAVAGLVAATGASAQASPWYAGAAIGQSKAAGSLIADREATIGGGNEPNLQTTSDLKDTSGKLFAGYRLSPLLALEAHYSRLGKQRIDNTFDVPFGQTGRGGVSTQREVDGFGLDLVAGWEATPGLTLFGKVGAFRGKVRTDTTLSGDTRFADDTPGTFRRVSASETVVKYGVGAEYAFTPRIAGRLEWERLPDLGERLEPQSSGRPGEATHDAVWLGVVYRFR